MAGALILIGLLAALIAFDFVAWCWGVDSTDGLKGFAHTWQWQQLGTYLNAKPSPRATAPVRSAGQRLPA
jgi:hypothetical protein